MWSLKVSLVRGDPPLGRCWKREVDPPKFVPVVFVFLLVNYLRKHLSFRDLSHFWGVCNFLHFESFLMGISMGPILILNIMAENDSNMIDLVLTHLTHPWGPPWTLETLGDHWRPLATCLKMTNFPQNGHFQACRKWPKCITGTGFSVPNHHGGPQQWSRWVRSKSIILEPFSDMICTI